MRRVYESIIFGFIIASILVVWMRTMSDPQHLTWNSWAYSEWLISYDTGFIRRGLGGWLIERVRRNGEWLPTVNLLVFLNYAALCLLLLWTWFRSEARSLLALVLAVLIPGSLLQMALGGEYFYRKEMLFHVALGVDCVLYGFIATAPMQARKEQLIGLFFGVILAQGVCLSLIHESYIFISFPAVFLLARDVAAMAPERRVFERLVNLSVLLQIVMFGICVIFKGNAGTVDHVWQTLSFADRSLISPGAPDTPSGGIYAIGFSGLFTAGLVAKEIISGRCWIWLFSAAGKCAILVLITVWQARDKDLTNGEGVLRHLRQLWFLFFVSLLLYPIAVDWGRWQSSVEISYLLVLFTIRPASIYPPRPLRLLPERFRPQISAALDASLREIARAVASSMVRHRGLYFGIALLFCLTFRCPEQLGTMDFSPFFSFRLLLKHLFV
jgi:hypothetical protein